VRVKEESKVANYTDGGEEEEEGLEMKRDKIPRTPIDPNVLA